MKRKKILFVCIENACRSQLAEAICNNLFSDQLIAYSAGSNPGTEVNPKAIKSLKSIGIAHRGENKPISDFLIEEEQRVTNTLIYLKKNLSPFNDK